MLEYARAPSVATLSAPDVRQASLAFPKIALVVSGDALSGAEQRAARIFGHLRRRGIEAELWISPPMLEALRQRFPELAAENAANILLNADDDVLARWLRRGRGRPALRSALGLDALEARWGMPRLDRRLRDRGIGLAHVFLAMSTAHLRACPALFEVTSPDIAAALSRWPSRRLRSYRAYHAVSEGVAERMAAFLPEDRLFTAPSPYFEPAPELLAPVQKRRRLTFAHRLIPRKNGVLFAEAAARFLKARPDWEVCVFGAGPDASEIASILGDQMAAGRVVVEQKPSIAAELAESRVFVSLIEPDNYPSQSVLEAMAASNALLLSDTGRSREKFLDRNGRSVPLDAAAVAEALVEMTADDASLEAMGRRSRDLVVSRYNADCYIDHLLETYVRTLEMDRSG